MDLIDAGTRSDQKADRVTSPAIDDVDNGATARTSPAISIRELNFSYDEAGSPKQVLFDIDLDIWPGEVALLTGPSGCGKTTLLTLIGGLRTVQSGQLHVLGRQLHGCATSELTEARRHIGFIFQMHNLLDFLTARQNVQMALQLHAELNRKEMNVRAQRMLDLVGLGPQLDSYPAQLSGGQKQRVSIARALPDSDGDTRHPYRRYGRPDNQHGGWSDYFWLADQGLGDLPLTPTLAAD